MGKTKLYFKEIDSEMCYSLEHHIEEARIEGRKQIELFEAVTEKIEQTFWCKELLSLGWQGDCGKQCKKYNPRNGKSGMCKHRSNTLYSHGEKVTIKIK
jgi:hypothetical protein